MITLSLLKLVGFHTVLTWEAWESTLYITEAKVQPGTVIEHLCLVMDGQ